MIVGYCRVSTIEQNPHLQLDALANAGCQRIFTDKASGANAARPELAKALSFLQCGDTLVVWKLDRLGRSLMHLLEILKKLEQRSVTFRSLTQNIDTSTATGRLMLSFLGAFAEFEREQMRERTIAGLAAARARGKKIGRRERFGRAEVREAREKLQIGLTVKEVIAVMRVSTATFYRGMHKYPA